MDSETEDGVVMSQMSGSESDPPTYYPDWPGPKSTYELEKEATIARNKVLLQIAFGGGVDAVNASSSPLPDQSSTAPQVQPPSSPGLVSTRVPSTTASTGPPPSSPACMSTCLPSDAASTGRQILPPSSPGCTLTSGDGHGSTSPSQPKPLPFVSTGEPLIRAPDWVNEAMTHLQVKGLGEEWAACVIAWWYFEKAVGEFSTGVRPSSISLQIAANR